MRAALLANSAPNDTSGVIAPLLNPINSVSARLGISRSTVYDLLGAGMLEAVRLGGRTLVPETSLARLVSSLQPVTVSQSKRQVRP